MGPYTYEPRNPPVEIQSKSVPRNSPLAGLAKISVTAIGGEFL